MAPVPLRSASRAEYRELVCDILNLLMGLPSDIFLYDRVNLKFFLNSEVQPLRFLAVSGAALALRCGSHYARLRALSQLGWSDPVMRAFCAALEDFLNSYRACLLALMQRKASLGFLELSQHVRRLNAQIEHLTQLCNLSIDEEDPDLRTCLPKGIELLACLYQKTQDYCGSPVGVLMLAMFREACRPFVQFLHEWTFHGFCRGGPDEFLIQTNEAYLNNRDKKYWCNAYELKGMRCYLLPETLMHDIFRCGKSLNLLRRIAPNHYIFTAAGSVPRLTLTLSPRATEWQLTAVQSYVSRMEQLGWHRQATRQQQHLHEELAKQELIRLAKETTLEELERLRSRAADAFRAEQARKQTALAELRREAEAAAERRVKEKEAEKEEDRRYVQEVALREQELRVYSQDMERQVRDELVAYYSRLSAEAAARELRALWRLRRRQLDAKRRLFLMRAEASWQQAMERHREATNLQVSILSMTDPSLSFMWSASILEDSTMESEAADRNNSAVLGLGETPRTGRARWAAPRADLLTEQKPPVAPKPKLNTPAKPPVPPRPKRTTWGAAAVPPLVLKESDQEELQERERRRMEGFKERNKFGHASQMTEEEPKKEVPLTDRPLGALKETDKEDVEDREKRRMEGFKERNKFGHASQMTEEEPKKEVPLTDRPLGALKETDKEDVEDRERRRMEGFKERNKFGHASQTSSSVEQRRVLKEEEEEVKKATSGALLESNQEELAQREQQRLDRFRERNQYGHASHSTVQRLLYGGDFGRAGTAAVEADLSAASEAADSPWTLSRSADYVKPFEVDFGRVADRPAIHALSERTADAARGVGLTSVYEEAREDEEEDGSLLPLPVIIRKALVKPLLAQIRLVNNVAINHFMVELDIRKYFTSLRHFLLLEDGEFGDSLCQLLFEKAATRPHEVCDMSFLNQVLSTALHHSRHASAPLADKLSFVLRSRPSATATVPGAEGPSDAPFDYLGLSCLIEWPLNIIITESSLTKYNKIFSFLLQMKFAVWAANDVYFKLRRDALAHPLLHRSPQLRRLHLCRHDMEHLLKVLEAYICQQVSQVTWNELEADLDDRNQHLDDLRRVHAEYLNRGLHRCLLTPKLRPLMKVVLGVFGHVHRFRRLLLAHPWAVSSSAQPMPCHSNFERLLATHTAFKEHTLFLHRVINKLVRRGARQRHLEQFLLLLDFTGHFPESVGPHARPSTAT